MSKILDLVLAGTTAQFDNDNSLATSAFVQRALGNMSGNAVVSGSPAILTAAHSGQRVACTSETLQLPDTATLPDGATFHISLVADTVTVTAAGSDAIHAGSSLSSSATAALPGGSTVTIIKVAAGTWVLTGSASLKYEQQFSAVIAPNGYQRLPGGLILQWGNGITAPTGVGTANFTLPFPNACLAATAFDMEDSPTNVCYAGTKWTATTLTATFARNGVAADAVTWCWIAIGH